MGTQLITENTWRSISAAVKKSKTKSFVAVAYFGKGGARMLPLRKGSMLLIDASEKAVKCGQTCPEELLKLYNKGVHIFSLENLHSKVFVIDNSLFIGSTNVSSHSAQTLEEALFKTSERKSVNDAKDYVKNFCKVELGTEGLMRLQKMYRPPRFFGGRLADIKKKSRINIGPSFIIYQLKMVDFTEEEQKQSERGSQEAEKKRINKSRHSVDEFRVIGKVIAKKNDIILQVIQENNDTYVAPPGILIHMRKWTGGKRLRTFCYVEIPDKKRKNLKWFNKKLNPKDRKLIKRGGKKSKEFANKIYSLWPA